MKFSVILFSIISLLRYTLSDSKACVPYRPIEGNSIVCVCNGTYCDTLDPLNDIPDGKFYHLLSSADGNRFKVSFDDLSTGDGSNDGEAAELTIYRNVKYQKMIGFGGAFTDATGENLEKLSSPELKDHILKAYFSPDGLDYNIARVPMGGTDFSSRPYAYCDGADGDLELNCFKLELEDLNYKIPFIKKALELKPDIKFFTSPWSAPTWMKTNGKFNETGFLKTEYYQVWANYFIRFLEEYEKHDIKFWALTTQNEPIHGIIGGGWNCMGWWPQAQRDFLKNNLGPALRNSSFSNVKVLILDDQRFQVVYWLRTILSDPEAAQYVSGVGLHWYANPYFPPTPLDIAHDEFPEYFMINTEACAGYLHAFPGINPVELGSWYRAELYAHNIIEDLNHWLSGWVEWNLVLDETGGPNWAGNMVDAPIIVNLTSQEAYKQPMYYALGHFTKFIPENSIRIHSSGTRMNDLETLSILREDGKTVVIVLNTNTTSEIPLVIKDEETGNIGQVIIGPRSLHTLVFSDKIGNENDNSSSSTFTFTYRILLVSFFLVFASFRSSITVI